MNAPKFEIGQKVKFMRDTDNDAGHIIGFSFDSEVGYRYQVQCKEVDIENKTIITGIKTCLESELVEVGE